MSASVLVIDDDPGFRGLAVRMLKAYGMTVAGEAQDARSGAAAAEALRPGAALVDVGLPDGDGIALGVELAALPWRPRVVLISSDTEVADLERPGPDGAQLPFVAKADLSAARLDELFAGD